MAHNCRMLPKIRHYVLRDTQYLPRRLQGPAVVYCHRHLDDIRRLQERAGAVKCSLDAQVATVQSRQQAEAQQEALEVQRMQQHWARLQVRAGYLLLST